jgi:Protein of unknown function (DUF1573)
MSRIAEATGFDKKTLQTVSGAFHTLPNARITGFAVVRCVLGLLLLTTAILKMSGGSGDIMRTALPFVSPRLYAAGILFEAVLGVWLLAGVAPAWSWLSSLGFFTLLAVLSCRLGIMGQASCGCAGRIPLNPWWAFGIDVVSVLALLWFRPWAIFSGIRAGLPALGGAMLMLAAGFGFLSWLHGSSAAAIAHLQGETIVVSPAVSDIGSGPVGQFQSFALAVTNYGDKPVRIVGGTSNCSCVSTDDLPVDIQPKQSGTINIRVKFTGSPGEFRRKFVLYCDEERLRVMPVAVTGRVTE